MPHASVRHVLGLAVILALGGCDKSDGDGETAGGDDGDTAIGPTDSEPDRATDGLGDPDPGADPGADPEADPEADPGGPDVDDPVDTGAGGPARGLDFPGSAAVSTTMRFRFLSPLPIYPATYIWRAYPRQQNGYYTAFFWGNDDGAGDLSTFLWDDGGADSYYGAHPYPNPPPDGSAHRWEISIEQQDFQNGDVVYDRWYVQALRVWSDDDGKHHDFYWDLPNVDVAHRVIRNSPASWGNQDPPVPALTWGDAPWAPGNEVWNGVLRGIQIYSANLSVSDILAEIEEPLSTEAGRDSIWYLNLSPTPDDIRDQSGNGNDPEWVGAERPSLWSEP